MIKTNNFAKMPVGNWKDALFILISSLIYLFDQRLNVLLGSNFLGSFLIVIVALLYCYSRQLPAKISTNAILILLSLTTYTALSYSLNSECHMQMKGGGGLLLFWLIFLTIKTIPLAIVVRSRPVSSLILLAAITFVLLDYYGLSFISGAKHAGLFNEASHLALYLLPLVVYRLLKSYKDKLAIAIIALVFLCSPSTTFLLGILLLISVLYLRNTGLHIILSSVLVTIFVGLFFYLVISGFIPMQDTQARVTNLLFVEEVEAANHLNISSLVWLNGWSQAFQTLVATNGFGVGFNQMGCGKYLGVGLYTPLIEVGSGGMLNAEDGSLLSAKLIAEFGYIGVILILFLTWKSLASLFAFVKNSIDVRVAEFEVICLRATGALCFFVLLFVRSASYFMLPVVLALSLLFFTKKITPISGAAKY